MMQGSKKQEEEIDFDTLSQEELDKEYEVLIDLSKDDFRKNIIKALGFSPEPDIRGYAKIKLKLSRIIQ